MNRRGTTRVITGALVALAGAVWGAIKLIPQPDSFWPLTWSGWGLWITVFLTISGFLWVVFGPFLKERLRGFLMDAETLRLQTELIVRILKTDSVKLEVRALVLELFADRIKETVQMWEEIDELKAEITSMRQSFGEVVRPSLERIERSTKGLEEQLQEARDSTARNIRVAVAEAIAEFRDHGGRRVEPRGK